MNEQHCRPHPDVQRCTELGHEISRQAAHIHAAQYRWLVLIREFDALCGWADQGCRSCAHWLNWRCGISLHTAREKVRVAKALGNLPLVSKAFEDGRVSYSKARAITRIAQADNEDFLLRMALQGTASQLDRLVGMEAARLKKADVRNEFNHARETRELHWFECEDGRVEFRGYLPKDQAARVIKALQVMDKDVPAGTPDQRRADALVRLSDEWLAGKRRAAASNDNYLVFLHVPAGTSTEPPRLEPGGSIPMEAARRICCDASLVPLVEDNAGTPLDIGRKTRKIPPAMRRALSNRDNGCCRFPGCSNTRFLDGHHIQHWANGGETKLGNLALLCSQHHSLVHEGGFGCEMHDDDLCFYTPDGQHIPNAWPLRTLTERGESRHDFENEHSGSTIHADTCLPDWYGDKMDYDLALNTLYDLRAKQECA